MNVRSFTPMLALVTWIVAAGTASAAVTVTVSCEKRSDRSRISVDAAGLARGNYYAVATSGGNGAQSLPQAARRGEVQADFDSNPNDIAAGATAIAANFIVDGKVTGTIVSAATGAEVASATGTCRVRN